MIKKIAIIIGSLTILGLILGFAAIPMAFTAKYTGPTITMKDGKELVTFVRLPEGDGPFPTLIVRSPYELPHTPLSGMPTEDFTDVPNSDLGQVGWPEVTEAGYALVIQHTRGRIGSQGAALGLKDREDAVELINWVKKQPWSNGKIGTTGDSIEAIMAMLANDEAPNLIDASYVQIGTPNLITDAMYGPGGVLKLETFLPWAGEQILTADKNHFTEVGFGPIDRRIARIGMGLKVWDILSDLENPQNLDAWKHLPIKGYPYFADATPSWNAMLDAKPNSAAAKHYDASLTDVPTYYVAAWFDVFAPSQITAFARGEKEELNQRLLILNGTHFTPEDPSVWPIKPMIPWFDYLLKGDESAMDNMPRVIFPIANAKDEWYGADTWPLSASETSKWYLSANGGLAMSESGPTKSATRTYDYDPDNPVPTVGGRNLMISHGPLDQRKVRGDKRDDVLSYDSGKLSEEVVVAGHVFGNLSVSSNAPDTDFTVKVLDIAPDGTATLVTEGILRARFREGLQKEVFMKSGETYQVEIDLGPIAWRFGSGHRIGIDISSSNFPQWARNLNTGAPLYSSVEKKVAKNTVFHGAKNGSYIELPIISDWAALERLTDFKTSASR